MRVLRIGFATTLLSAACGTAPSESPGRLPQDGGGAAEGGAPPPSSWDGSRPDPLRDASPFDGSGIGNPDAACATVDVVAERLTPAVHLLVRTSNTMQLAFPGGGPPRFEVLQAALLNDVDGIVTQLEARVAFSLALFKELDPQQSCPEITRVPLGFDNRSAMRGAMQEATLSGSGPIAEALQITAQTAAAERRGRKYGPELIVLANQDLAIPCRYEPDFTACAELEGVELANCELNITQNDYIAEMERVADAAAEAHGLGFEVIVLNLAVDNEAASMTLQRVANEGAGLPRDGVEHARMYEVGDAEALRDALDTIAATSDSCELALEGRLVESRACEGEVLLDGKPLRCDDANGWRVLDPERIELRGSACETWKAAPEATVRGAFPCDVVYPPD